MSIESDRGEILRRIGIPLVRSNLSAGGLDTACVTAGEGDPVLLIHGAGAGAVQWYRIIEPLARHFRVVAPDVVGYGESAKPASRYDRPFFSAWTKDLLDALSTDNVHIVGSSQGEAIALQFAKEYPQYVRRLVVINSAGFSTRNPAVPIRAFLNMLWLHVLPSRSAFHRYSRYLVHDPDSLDPVLASYALSVIKLLGGRRAFWQGRGRVTAPFSAAELAQIGCPVLVLWGERDRLFPSNQARTARDSLANAQLRLLPDAGHLSILERPDEIVEATVEFLRSGSTA